MKLIIGLGNPGRKYRFTRHNIGFFVIDELASQLNIKLKKDNTMHSEISEINFDGEKIILAKPATFMNKSGDAVKNLKSRFSIKNENIWVISDDATMNFGKLRIRDTGSSGGHNGLKSIIENINKDFIRFRIGIDEPQDQIPMDKWVLGKFTRDQKKQLNNISKKAVEKIISMIKSKNVNLDTEDLKIQ